jgi:hypothetical protein
MPIKAENKKRYPVDWPAISLAAKERAGWRCQHPGCTARQYSVGVWEGRDFFFELCQEPSYAEARQRAADESFARNGDGPAPADEKIIVIVLTVAHLNHQPEDCQRHHLAYDHDHHRATAWATRRARAGTLELF